MINYENILKIFKEIKAERIRQDEKYGEQNLALIPSPFTRDDIRRLSLTLKRLAIKKEGKQTWFEVLAEEVCESFAESETAVMREEMVQVAAVAVQIIEYLDREIADQRTYL